MIHEGKKEMKHSEVFHIRMKPEMKQLAQAKADSQDVSLAHVIRELIKAWLKE